MTHLRLAHDKGEPLDPEIARQTVLTQHKAIRELLDEAQSISQAALAGDAQAALRMPALFHRVRLTLDSHLAFEESVLLPILEADLPLGPQRAQALQREHQRQRRELLRMQDAELVTWAGEGLASGLRQLVREFLVDMIEEERVLLIHEVIRDDLVTVEQEAG